MLGADSPAARPPSSLHITPEQSLLTEITPPLHQACRRRRADLPAYLTSKLSLHTGATHIGCLSVL
ncbi:hypothetical protein BDW75DRAFT_216839 [Aspergillus navahoensis]